jgi:hypothetical protein
MSKLKKCIQLLVEKDFYSILRNEIKIIDDIPADKLDEVLANLEKAAKDAGKTLDDYLDDLVKQANEATELAKKGLRKATQKDVEELAKIRKLFNAGKNKNVAFTKGEIGGKKIDLKSRSGEPKGTPENFDNFKQIEPENYHYKNGPIPDYINHTEQKQIEYLYEMFKHDKKISGKIEIVSDLKICRNCDDIIYRFKKDFPNIEVIKVWVKDKL